VAGIDNYIYKNEDRMELVEQFVELLEKAGLTYALTELNFMNDKR
jgi:hypothetical protein